MRRTEMTTGTRYTVLGHGEAYIGTDYSPPRRAVVGTEEPPAFERAQALLRPQFEAVASSVRALKPGQRLDEVVVELRLNERFLAKSYRPDDLLKNTGLTARGMGTWEQTLDAARAAKKRPKRAKDAPEEVGPVSVPSLSIYASGTDKSLQRLRDAIEGSVGGPAVRGDLAHLEAIRLPTVQDRAIELETVDSDPMPIEIVLYDWDQRHRDAAVSRLRAIALRSGVVEEDFLVRSYTDGPTFVATVVPHDAVDEIRDLNFLRLARPLPRIALTRTALTMKMTAPPAPGKATPVAWIAAFDGGCKADLPHFDGSVVARDLTSKPEIPGYVSHGTAVASAAVYGSIAPGGTLSPPACGVLALRVLPDARNSLELYGAIDAIEYEVPRLAPEIQVVNLSFGPAGPITPSKPPSRFTYAIDRLTFETKKLFFTAVGNWGDKVGFDGIQSPSDSVSNVSVGAYEVNPANGHRRPAAYTCKGPGRSGGVRKPDLLAFGGSHAAPFIVLDPSPGEMEGTMGTSFACPTAASLAAQVLARVDAPISEQACRALLIHATEPLDGESPHATGWGVLPPHAGAGPGVLVQACLGPLQRCVEPAHGVAPPVPAPRELRPRRERLARVDDLLRAGGEVRLNERVHPRGDRVAAPTPRAQVQLLAQGPAGSEEPEEDVLRQARHRGGQGHRQTSARRRVEARSRTAHGR